MLRPISILSIAALLPLASACVVPQNRYDTAVSRLDAERTAHEADRAELAKKKDELRSLSEALGSREKNLFVRESELAQSKLEGDRMTTERDDAVQLVEQLRGELGRVGGTLQEFSEQKKSLEAALTEAEERQKRLESGEKLLAAKILLVRDLTMALAEPIAAGQASVTVVQGKPAVRLEAKAVFGEKAGSASGDMPALFDRLASVLAKRDGARLELGDRSSDSITPEDRIVRLQRIADLLTEKGIGYERIGLALSPAALSSAPPAEAEKADPPPKATSFRDGPGSLEIVIDVAPLV